MSIVQLIRRNADKEFSLVDLIKSSMAERSISPPIYEDTWIRVSSIGTLCEREEVLCSINNVERERVVSADSAVNFAHGHAVHWMFQSKILADLGVLIGAWRCTYCGTQYGSRKTIMVPRPKRCYRCGATAGGAGRIDNRPTESDDQAFVYVEEWVGNFEYKIGGQPDGQMLLDWTPEYKLSDITLLEFKSCNDNSFKLVDTAPDFVHVIQGNVYMWLTGYRKLKIVYFNKSDRGTDGIREYDLDYDEECMERILAAVKTVRDGIATRIVPPRTVCGEYSCSRAYRCKVRNICFEDMKEVNCGPDSER